MTIIITGTARSYQQISRLSTHLLSYLFYINCNFKTAIISRIPAYIRVCVGTRRTLFIILNTRIVVNACSCFRLIALSPYRLFAHHLWFTNANAECVEPTRRHLARRRWQEAAVLRRGVQATAIEYRMWTTEYIIIRVSPSVDSSYMGSIGIWNFPKSVTSGAINTYVLPN